MLDGRTVCVLALAGAVVIGALVVPPTAHAAISTSTWRLSGNDFLNGTFQNTSLSASEVRLSNRTEPTNRSMVLDVGPPGSADSQGMAWESVWRESDGSYKMYYTGNNGPNSILLARSSNGFDWTKYGVVLAPSPSGGSPSVMKIGSTYHMWFEITSSGGPLGYSDEIYHATSPDGFAWTVQGLALGLGPSGAWDSAIVADARVVVDATGLYRMYYSGIDTSGDTQIGVATSRDLATWTRFAQNPIMSYGPRGSWDNPHVAVPSVVLEASTWTMYFNGNQNGSPLSVGRAESGDGYNWTMDPSNPVITAEAYPRWDDVSVGMPALLKDPSGLRLYYSGGNGTTSRIGVYLFGPPPAINYSGRYTSQVFDSGAAGTSWLSVTASATVPSGTSIGLRVRSGNNSTPDGTWATWAPTGRVSSLPRSHYAQLAIDFSSTSWNLTPEVASVSLSYAPNGAPNGVPTSPSAAAWINMGRPLLRWTLSDPENDSVIAVRVQVSRLPDFLLITQDSGNLTPGATSWQLPSPLQDGLWYWRVQAEDSYGAWGTWRSSQILVDTLPPALTVSNPAPGTLLHSTSLDVIWYATDAFSGIDHVTVSLDANAAISVGAGNSSVVLNSLSDGTHTVRVTAADRAGNQASMVLSFTVNTNLLDTNGPYGASPLVGVIVLAAAVASVAVILYFRRRKRPPGPENQS